MTIRVITVPRPAAGADWLYRIPGQWVANLIGVTATLTTTANPSQVVDSSGNNHNADVNSTWPGTFQAVGPFAGGASNFAAAYGGPAVNLTNSVCAATPLSAFFAYGSPLALDYWVRPDLANLTGGNWCFTARNAVKANGGNNDYQYGNLTGGGDPWDLRYTLAGAGVFTVADVAANGVWVHMGHTWDGVNWTTFKNGVLLNTHAGNGPTTSATPSIHLHGGGNQSGPLVGAMAGIAHYNAGLVAADYLAHFNASASAAAYQTAVLASAPKGLWMMGDLLSKTSRQANLVVTDGTTTVVTYPAGFSVTNAGVFNWSWQVLGPSSAQTVDGSQATVNIPELYLPGGYTVGARTLDLVSTDQWSAITLTFDDGTGPGVFPTPVVGGTEYLNALLVPDYSHKGA